VPPDDVQDVVAETFLTAWRRLGDVPEDAVPWLFATARLHIANRHRSSRRRQALGERLMNVRQPIDDQPTDIERREVDERLLEAIRRLPPKEREALMLVAWDGLTPRRAARAAGCGAPAFRVRLHRARARLKRALEAASPDLGPRPRATNTQMEEAR
jgi:RNA polymerase sigma factor (sigma-70 family)